MATHKLIQLVRYIIIDILVVEHEFFNLHVAEKCDGN